MKINLIKTALALFVLISSYFESNAQCLISFTYAISGSQITFTNTSTGVPVNAQYSWSFDYYFGPNNPPTNPQYSNLVNPTFTIPQTGQSYYANLQIIECGAGHGESLFIPSSPNGISENYSQNVSFTCFPNPITDNTSKISYILSGDAAVELNLFDVVGKKIFNENYGNKSSGIHVADITSEGLSNGIYIMQLKVNNQLFSEKIVVNK